MSNNYDYANAEINGLARFFPTAPSKNILIGFLPVASGVFYTFREHFDWFFSASYTGREKTLIALLIACSVCAVAALALFVELCGVINRSKHGRITHYSNAHPWMSARFFLDNASARHWLSLGCLCLAFFAAGYFFNWALT